ncbi:MAG TPA: hypothetical protein DCF33_19245, partial [Saprospirales bacterium]|nr:hypothetical protein [Saprospirales bacterium]
MIDNMKKQYLILSLYASLLFCPIINLIGQPAIQWQRCFGGNDADEAVSVEQTMDGGYIVAGSSSSTDGDV